MPLNMIKRIFILCCLLSSAIFAGEVKTIDGHTYTGPIQFENDQIVIKTADDPVRLNADQIDQLNVNTPTPNDHPDHPAHTPAVEIPTGGHGWLGSYFDDANLSSLLFSRADPSIEFDWRGKKPDPRMNGPFSASWLGNVTPPSSGNYRFNVVSRGGVRVMVDGKILIDRWKGNNVDSSASLPLTAGKAVPVLIEYTNTTGDAGLQLVWSYADAKKVPIPVDAVALPTAGQRHELSRPRGLLGQYFDDETFTTERLRRHDPMLNFRTIITNPLTWPDPQLPEKFAARWTGKLLSPGEGTYTITMDVDDVARLYLDGKPIIDAWQQHSGKYQAVFVFHAGQTYDFKLDYSNRMGQDAALSLMWSGHGHHMEPIDAAYFAPPADDTFADPRAMLTPPAKTIYAEGEPIDLAADVSVDDGDHLRQVDFIVDDKVIGSATDAPYRFRWTNPVIGRHLVLAQAVDDKGFKGRSARYQLTVAAKAPAALGDGWMAFRIGDRAPADPATSNASAITVTAGPGDLWSNSDAFQYIFHPLDGDGSLTAQLVSIDSDAAGDLSSAGLMIRNDLSAASAEAVLMAIRNPQPSAMFLHREWTGADPAYDSSPTKLPTWLRIERAGNHVRSYLSATGEHWTPVGDAQIQIGDSLYIGLAVTGKGAAHAAAVFDHVELHTGTFTTRPLPSGLQEINGTLLAGDIISADADKTRFRFHGKEIDVKPADIARIVLRSMPGSILAAVESGKKGALLATGDLAEGDDIEYHDGRVVVSSVLFGKQNFGLDTAIALIVNDLSPAKGGYTITTTDGCIYQSPQLKLNGNQLILDDAIAGTVSLNSGEIRAINKLADPK